MGQPIFEEVEYGLLNLYVWNGVNDFVKRLLKARIKQVKQKFWNASFDPSEEDWANYLFERLVDVDYGIRRVPNLDDWEMVDCYIAKDLIKKFNFKALFLGKQQFLSYFVGNPLFDREREEEMWVYQLMNLLDPLFE
jgi:hypothetical protein